MSYSCTYVRGANSRNMYHCQTRTKPRLVLSPNRSSCSSRSVEKKSTRPNPKRVLLSALSLSQSSENCTTLSAYLSGRSREGGGVAVASCHTGIRP